MEGGRKQTGSSSYSISSELFGSKSSSTSPPTTSKGIFDSVFAPPSSYQRTESWRTRDFGKQGGWNSKQESQGNTTQCNKGENQDVSNKGRSIFQDESVEPCYLSSSIYYGGQDVYSDPSKPPRSTVSPHIFKKNGEDDDPNGSNNSASRGNWWQGSLYY